MQLYFAEFYINFITRFLPFTIDDVQIRLLESSVLYVVLTNFKDNLIKNNIAFKELVKQTNIFEIRSESLNQEIIKQILFQSKEIYKTDSFEKGNGPILYFIVKSFYNQDLKILLFTETETGKMKQLNSNPDFAAKYYILDHNAYYFEPTNQQNSERIKTILKVYHKSKPVDIDFTYILLGITINKSISGGKFIDEQIYLNTDSNTLYQLSLTNNYVKDIINNGQFVREYFEKQSLPIEILLDKPENMSYYNFFAEIANKIMKLELGGIIRNVDGKLKIMDADELYLSNRDIKEYPNFTKFLISIIDEKAKINFNIIKIIIESFDLDFFVYIIREKTIPDEKIVYYIYSLRAGKLDFIKYLTEDGFFALPDPQKDYLLRTARYGYNNGVKSDEILPRPEIYQYLSQQYNMTV